MVSKKKTKDIYDDLRELEYLNYENENPSENHFKKIIISVSAILISILFISYVFLGFPLYGIIIGQIRSDSARDNILRTNNLEIIFKGNTLDQSVKAWYDNPDVETTLCLRGVRDGNKITIQNLYQPKIFSQSYTHVSHEPCDDDTILMFHTHPYKRCTASETDLRTLARAKQRNPDIAMIIMCEENRFSVYD